MLRDALPPPSRLFDSYFFPPVLYLATEAAYAYYLTSHFASILLRLHYVPRTRNDERLGEMQCKRRYGKGMAGRHAAAAYFMPIIFATRCI